MRLSEVSVKRPVFATVISLMLVILGLLAATRLPIRECPNVESPVVSIETNYRGASADVVETKITQVIEDRVAGLEGVTKITSQSVDGRSSINLEFDPDRPWTRRPTTCATAWRAWRRGCREEADPPEIGKVDFNAEPIMYVNLSSDTHERARAHRLRRARARRPVSACCPGVARVRINGGRRYAMRVWIDREALAARQLTVVDIENALRRENVQLPAGRLESSQREFTLRTETGLNTEQDFRQLVDRARRPTATWCGWARSPTCGSPPRTSAALSRSNGVPGISLGDRADLEGQHARGRPRGARGDRAAAPGPAAGHGARDQHRPVRCSSRSR